MQSEVARHYARVLLDTAAESDGGAESLDRLAAGLGEFADALAASPELAGSLQSPALPRKRRAQLAQAVGDRLAPDTGSSSLLGRFAALMVEKERAALLPETAIAFREALDARRGLFDAEVVSARPLDEAGRTRFQDALGAAFSGAPRLRFRTDPDLLGGFVLRIGNRIYDASVSRKLARFEAAHGA